MAADALLGDPRRGHPVAGFGRVALALERRWWAPEHAAGVRYTAALVGATTIAAALVERRVQGHPAIHGALVAATIWATVGGRSLRTEALGIAALLEEGDIEAARARIPALVGRDPTGLDGPALCRAALESVAENTADAVVGPLVWCGLLGARGAIAYRAANTLDAMVGHRSERYQRFGWAAAKLDDIMSWPASRAGALVACALAPAVGGRIGPAAATVAEYGGRHPSPNAGRIEAAFAGALGVRLGGPLSYGGRAEERPVLGDGRTPGTSDLRRAVRLSQWVGLACAALACAPWRRLLANLGRSPASRAG